MNLCLKKKWAINKDNYKKFIKNYNDKILKLFNA